MIKTKNGGFGLIEVIVYISVLVLVVTFVVGGAMKISDGVVTVRASRNLNRSAALAMERILRDIKDAQGIDPTVMEPAYQGQISTALALSTRNEQGQLETVRFFADENGLLITQKGEGERKALTAADVAVQNLTFTKLTTPHSEAVRVFLELADREQRISQTREYFGAAVFRESY